MSKTSDLKLDFFTSNNTCIFYDYIIIMKKSIDWTCNIKSNCITRRLTASELQNNSIVFLVAVWTKNWLVKMSRKRPFSKTCMNEYWDLFLLSCSWEERFLTFQTSCCSRSLLDLFRSRTSMLATSSWSLVDLSRKSSQCTCSLKSKPLWITKSYLREENIVYLFENYQNVLP